MARSANEPYVERASPQSLDVKLWRTYRGGDYDRHFAGGKFVPSELELRSFDFEVGILSSYGLTDNRSWR